MSLTWPSGSALSAAASATAASTDPAAVGLLQDLCTGLPLQQASCIADDFSDTMQSLCTCIKSPTSFLFSLASCLNFRALNRNSNQACAPSACSICYDGAGYKSVAHFLVLTHLDESENQGPATSSAAETAGNDSVEQTCRMFCTLSGGLHICNLMLCCAEAAEQPADTSAASAEESAVEPVTQVPPKRATRSSSRAKH